MTAYGAGLDVYIETSGFWDLEIFGFDQLVGLVEASEPTDLSFAAKVTWSATDIIEEKFEIEFDVQAAEIIATLNVFQV